MMNNNWIKLGVAFAALLIVALLYRAMFWTFVDNYEFAYKFDAIGGEITAIKNPDGSPKQGYVFSWPLIERIHTIETRPMQVCINANSRVLNCKLVHFNPDGFELFISWHGRGNYRGMNLEQILMSYAYDPSQANYPFIKIMKELKNQDIISDDELFTNPLNIKENAEKDDKQEDKE